MPRLTTPTTAMIRRASHLPQTSPMRQAARAELAAIRSRFGVNVAVLIAEGNR